MALKIGQQYVLVWRQSVDSQFDLHCHACSHEEADTKIIFHAIKAKERGATQLDVYSPDIDVSILLIRRYPQLPKKTSLVIVMGHNREEYRLIRHMMDLGQQKQLPCQDFTHLRELTLQGKGSYNVGKCSTKQMKM